jgi:HTH-type transcriptional regulator/antitoxin HipB
MHIRRPEDFGALIRSARIARGLNQKQFADRLGTSRWWVVEMERGKSAARLDLVLRALNELDVALTASIGEPNAAPPAGPIDLIDIDAIADTGLDTRRPGKSAQRRGR